MIILSILFSVTGGITGAYVSFANNKMPTGPWIVTMTSLIAVLSILLAPKKGIIPKYILRKKYQNKMLRENLLKELYHLEEKHPDRKSFKLEELLDERQMRSWNFVYGLRMLRNRKLVNKLAGNYILSDKGHEEGKRITRIHRLWEMYLTQHLNIASDHVHEDAEAIEHIITPEVEKKLIELLAYPEKDPHEKDIPY